MLCACGQGQASPPQTCGPNLLARDLQRLRRATHRGGRGESRASDEEGEGYAFEGLLNWRSSSTPSGGRVFRRLRSLDAARRYVGG